MSQHPLRFLREEFDFKNFDNIIEEGKDGKEKTYWVVGPTIVSEAENKNGRRYQKSVCEREVERFQKNINENRSAGELGHPSTPEINLERISHYIKELKQDGNIWIGKHQVASTPMGNIAKALINDGYKMGISTRGLGTVKDGIVGEDFRLITADLVSEPSGPGCFVESIVENKQWIIDESGKITEAKIEMAYDVLENKLADMPKHDVEKYMMEAISGFISKIQNG